ncbi:MAG: XRE family transcriptional regulator [Chloroflexi bacterium]|nr:XRE family transcriptional regulator [Chloroflexota bacterium]
MAFAETLRRLRLEQFLSQAELARRAGLHALTVTRLESGGSAPTTRTVRKIATVLSVEPRELAVPEEVAELRRVLAPTRTKEALDAWVDGGGSVDTTQEPIAAASNTRPDEA